MEECMGCMEYLLLEVMKVPPGDLASDEKEDDDLSGFGQLYQLMLFLWAIKNLRPTRVTISNAPTSELFDIAAQ
jgi:hypothetical protein